MHITKQWLRSAKLSMKERLTQLGQMSNEELKAEVEKASRGTTIADPRDLLLWLVRWEVIDKFIPDNMIW